MSEKTKSKKIGPGAGLSVAVQRPAGAEDGWWTPEGHLRLRPDFWPGRGHLDGFFATVLAKTEG